MSESVADLVSALMVEQGPRLVSTLAKHVRDIELAEEAVQEAWVRALSVWPEQGVPARPLAWVFTTAKRWCIDRIRRRSREADVPDLPAEPAGEDRVALLFAVCHPSIDPRAQVGLALRILCGLDNEQLARAFVSSAADVSRRLSRASRKIRDARIPFAVPGPGQRRERLAAVLASIYLVFNEGFTPTASEGTHPRLCSDAIRLGEAVSELLPDEPECGGLVALMRLNHARRDARFDPRGRPVLLESQDRTRWHQAEIEVGLQVLHAALSKGAAGPYQIQASIAALHAEATRAEDTDWQQISMLYGLLLRHQPSPVVELNAAVALAMVKGPEVGLAWMARIEQTGLLAGYHLLPAARGALFARLGRTDDAIAAYDEALALATHPGERAQLAAFRDACRPVIRRRRSRRSPRSAGLTDRQWDRVRGCFAQRRGRGRPSRPDRELLEAVLWVLATGSPWRDLPSSYGPWQTAYHRFRRWEQDGTLSAVLRRLDHHAAGAVLASLTPLRSR